MWLVKATSGQKREKDLKRELAGRLIALGNSEKYC